MCSATRCCTSLQNLPTSVVEISLLVDKTLKDDQSRGSFISSKYMYVGWKHVEMSSDCTASAHVHRVRVRIKTVASDFGCALIVHDSLCSWAIAQSTYVGILGIVSHLSCLNLRVPLFEILPQLVDTSVHAM